MTQNLLFRLGRLWPRLSLNRPQPNRPQPNRPQTSGPDSGLLPEISPAVRVRPATKADYEQICDLYEELDSFHRQARPDLFDRASAPPRNKATIAAFLESEATTILVAQHPNSSRLLGFALLAILTLPASSVCLARRFVEIDKIAVRADSRRAGVARAIVERAFDWAAARGAASVEVAVHDFNTGAIEFYAKMGFTTMIRRMMRLSPR